jgi:lysophospholipase L1-like esterase
MAGTNRRLTFGGSFRAKIGAGKEIWSDPVAMEVPADHKMTVSLYASYVTDPLTEHTDLASLGTGNMSFVSRSGNHAAEESATSFTQQPNTSTMVVNGLDVLPDTYTEAVVALGDSITDGAEAGPQTNTRWPDYLSRRFLAQPPERRMAVLNQGIGANQLLGDGATSGPLMGGPSALKRFDRDVLGQSNVSAVILLEGINDMTAGKTPAQIIAAQQQLIDRVHQANVGRVQEGKPRIRIFGATLTPAYSALGPGGVPSLQARHEINAWIRTSAPFDGVIDFDAATKDPNNIEFWQPGTSFDQLHGNALGYQLMGNKPDLDALRGDGCVR